MDQEVEPDTPSLGNRGATWCRVSALASGNLDTDPGVSLGNLMMDCVSAPEKQR